MHGQPIIKTFWIYLKSEFLLLVSSVWLYRSTCLHKNHGRYGILLTLSAEYRVAKHSWVHRYFWPSLCFRVQDSELPPIWIEYYLHGVNRFQYTGWFRWKDKYFGRSLWEKGLYERYVILIGDEIELLESTNTKALRMVTKKENSVEIPTRCSFVIEFIIPKLSVYIYGLFGVYKFDIHGSMHRRWLSRNTNKMQLWNNKFYYKAASCWYFYWVIYDARIHEYQTKKEKLLTVNFIVILM
jgi:hypothetical protein